ncbi:MAG: type II toxin-antitoxin system death-on-curing family toxin [Vampirovibrionales bacterium]|nr:type II toxin-antitoxin system death-on-curing family toxin [Vampirovibrionales bacterium]
MTAPKETVYLMPVEVLAIHQTLIAGFGGGSGLREAGALEAALYRPQTGYYDDVIQEAAALWESLTQNHPFVDGNKRVAFAVMDIFLRLNGFSLTASKTEVIRFIDTLFAEKRFEYAALWPWLQVHVKPS